MSTIAGNLPMSSYDPLWKRLKTIGEIMTILSSPKRALAVWTARHYTTNLKGI